MSRRFVPALVSLAALAGLPCIGFAQDGAATAKPSDKSVAAPAPAYTVTTLSGGTKLVVLREPDSQVVVTDVFFNVTRADEGQWNGINALIARMWGVESEWRSAALTRRDINQIGAAGTDIGDDWVEIWAVSGTEDEDVSTGFRTLLTNLVANPHFSAETLASAKAEQAQAHALADDPIWSDGLDHLRERVWGTLPRARPLLGTADGLSSLKATDVARYYARQFRPERAVICIAGPVDPTVIARKVKAALGAGDWLNGSPAPKTMRTADVTIPTNLRDFPLGRSAPSVTLLAGFLAPGTEDAPSYATWLLLDAALTGGKSSRLFQTLRDEASDSGFQPLGYDIRSVPQAGQAQSLWAIYVVGDAAPQTARARLMGELRAVVSDKPLSDDEIERARQWLKGHHLRERQRIRDRTAGAGWSELMGLGTAFDLDFDKKLDAVTPDAVRALATRLLSAPSAVVYNQLMAPIPAPVPTLPRETTPVPATPAAP